MSDPGQGAAGVAAIPELYVSDVDHTLLDNAGTLSGYSRATLNRLLAQGLRFTVASARCCAGWAICGTGCGTRCLSHRHRTPE